MLPYIKDGGSLKYSIVESFCSLTFMGKKRGWGYNGMLTTQSKDKERKHKGKMGCVSEIPTITKAEEIAGTRKDSE